MGSTSIRKEIRRAEREIDKAVDAGVQGSSTHDGILDEAIDRGKQTIREKDRVWHKQVLNGFKTELVADGHTEVWRIFNRSPHANVVNEGAEYDSRPPVDALLPWVRDHLYLFPADEFPTARSAAWALSTELYKHGQEGILFTAVMLEYLRVEAERDLEQYLNRRLEARL